VAAPRWLVDEMLGRLARYLRFVGCDTVYVRGLDDDAIVELARREERVLLTRDRELARRVPGSLLVASPAVGEQWRAVRAAYPELATAPTFVRCSLCNGVLERADATAAAAAPELPPGVRAGAEALFRCGACGHLYWEGSHTARIRERLDAWSRGGPT